MEARQAGGQVHEVSWKQDASEAPYGGKSSQGSHTKFELIYGKKNSSKPNPTRATFSPREYLVVPEDNIAKEMLQAQWDRESTNIL